MDRRKFVQLGVVGAAAGLALAGEVSGSAGSPLDSDMAGGVFYTEKAPGRWAKKVGGHLPKIEKKVADGKIEISVSTSHGMNAWKHYIVKHMLLDKDFKFIAEKMFDPTKDKRPKSTFSLDRGYRGPLYALSVCNKHDTWISVISV